MRAARRRSRGTRATAPRRQPGGAKWIERGRSRGTSAGASRPRGTDGQPRGQTPPRTTTPHRGRRTPTNSQWRAGTPCRRRPPLARSFRHKPDRSRHRLLHFQSLGIPDHQSDNHRSRIPRAHPFDRRSQQEVSLHPPAQSTSSSRNHQSPVAGREYHNTSRRPTDGDVATQRVSITSNDTEREQRTFSTILPQE